MTKDVHVARTSRRIVLCFAGIVLLGAMGACSRPLLAPTDERTPFDRYDAVRAKHATQYVEDEYGRRQPNLRGRLSPKD